MAPRRAGKVVGGGGGKGPQEPDLTIGAAQPATCGVTAIVGECITPSPCTNSWIPTRATAVPTRLAPAVPWVDAKDGTTGSDVKVQVSGLLEKTLRYRRAHKPTSLSPESDLNTAGRSTHATECLRRGPPGVVKSPPARRATARPSTQLARAAAPPQPACGPGCPASCLGGRPARPRSPAWSSSQASWPGPP